MVLECWLLMLNNLSAIISQSFFPGVATRYSVPTRVPTSLRTCAAETLLPLSSSTPCCPEPPVWMCCHR